jgi:hypothetical protein
VTNMSPAGMSLFGSTSPVAAGSSETEEERRKRLAAVQQQRDKLGMSSAGYALALSGGAYSA